MNQLETDGGSLKAVDKRTARTQAALREALLSLLEERAFEQLTVREITGRAGVGYATFFRRYPDKEALLHDLAANEIGKLLAMTVPVFYTVDSLPSTHALCTYVWEHRQLWTALLTGGAAAVLKEEYLNQALRVLEEHRNPESWLPGDLAVTFAVTATVEVLGWWLKQEDPPSVEEMARIVNRLTVAPIMPGAEEEGRRP